jgi:cystathionine beta-lyase
MEFPDLPALVAVARREGRDGRLDNTWGAGIAFDPFDLCPGQQPALGVDISVQALTKYASGGADLLMGSVTTRDHALHLRLKFTHMRMGWGVGANDIEAVLLSLPSLEIRYAAQDRAARTLARGGRAVPEVAQVLHPRSRNRPDIANWKALCTQAAGLFSIVSTRAFRPAQIDAFLDALRLFKLGYSWAGPSALSSRTIWRAASERGQRGTLVRFSIGLEGVDDLIEDARQALAALACAVDRRSRSTASAGPPPKCETREACVQRMVFHSLAGRSLVWTTREAPDGCATW